MRRAALALLLALLMSTVAARDAAFTAFRSGSLDEVLAERRDQPFLLVLWSVTCAPCRQEFELLRDLRAAHPHFPLVLVSTDDIADKAMANKVLSRYGLTGEESWIFDGDAQRLRYEIDPTWYGELPRAYFYDAAHQRQAVSGSLDRGRVEEWIMEAAGNQ